MYSRPTLIWNWHKHREAEPKDYDFTLCPDGEKKLNKSTYKHLGTCEDADWSTSTETQMSQYLLKNVAQKTPKMVEADHFQSADFDRRGGVVREQDSSYTVDYPSPHDHSQEERSAGRPSESRPDFRKRRSQFNDVADGRRPGRHTWQDESGVYSNLGNRTSIHTGPTNPICP